MRIVWSWLAVIASICLVACTGSGSAALPPTALASPVTMTTIVATPTASVPRTPVPAATFPFTVTDSANRSITLRAAPRRIISTSPGLTEILFAIGAGDRLVGADDFSDYPEAARALPRVGYSRLDFEKIVGLNPDLVLITMRQQPFLADLEKLNLTVIYLVEPENIPGVFANIRLLGRITDRAAAAEEVATGLERRYAAIQQRVADISTGPRIFHELTPELFTVGPKTFIGDMYRTIKAQNIVTAETPAFPKLSLEAIVAADPEVIILADGGDLGQSSETVKARPGWSTITAVRTGRIYVIDTSLISRPGPRVIDGLEALAKAIYPERFR